MPATARPIPDRAATGAPSAWAEPGSTSASRCRRPPASSPATPSWRPEEPGPQVRPRPDPPARDRPHPYEVDAFRGPGADVYGQDPVSQDRPVHAFSGKGVHGDVADGISGRPGHGDTPA